MGDIRVEPGISVVGLIVMSILLYLAFSTYSILWLCVLSGYTFKLIIVDGFWPYLTEEEKREIRRRKILGDDDTDRDT